MRSRVGRSWLAGTLAFALAGLAAALTACSAGAPGPAPRPTATGAQDAPAPPTPGPLEVFFDAAAFGQTQAEAAAELAAREEAIAACMAEQGFDYEPVVMVPGSFEASDDPPRGTREYAQAFGYGVWRQPEVEPGQVTYLMDDAANRAYRESLSPVAQGAYDVALLGESTQRTDGEVTQVTYDGTGCTNALLVGTGDDRAYLYGILQEVADYLQSLWDGADPRLAEVDATWAACMRDTGYTDASPYAAEARIVAEISAAYEAAGEDSLPPEAVEEYAAAERRLALADLDCRESTDWAARRRAVEHELQQEYVAAHRADLEALAAASGDAPGDVER